MEFKQVHLELKNKFFENSGWLYIVSDIEYLYSISDYCYKLHNLIAREPDKCFLLGALICADKEMLGYYEVDETHYRWGNFIKEYKLKHNIK